MKLEDYEGLRILTCEYGYIIHNKTNDSYSYEVYLGKNATLDDFEEVIDNSLDPMLKNAIFTIKNKEESLTKVAKIVANQVTDDTVALTIQEFYDEWQPDINVIVGQYIRYESILYKVLTNHTTQANWTPSETPSLFAKVLVDPTGETILEWEQPDSTNPYMTGNKVTYNGKTYVCKIDNNVWQPDVYGWEEIA